MMQNGSIGTEKSDDALRVMELSTAITRLCIARNQVLNRVAAPFGLTAVQVMALHHISATPACTPREGLQNLPARLPGWDNSDM
ncbi:MAG TPA: hypothetical protein PKJ73_12210, partial [Ottowia sp.]|nr:hypothetical protein [Ottowia sp.]